MTTGKIKALTRWTFVDEVMSLVFNMLSGLIKDFLPRSKHLLISWLQLPSAVSVQFSSVAQSCPTLCDPVDCSRPGSSVHGILQARILKWVAISFSRGSSRPRGWTRVSCTAGRFFTYWATREAQTSPKFSLNSSYYPSKNSWLQITETRINHLK